jgi:hypothetical protein
MSVLSIPKVEKVVLERTVQGAGVNIGSRPVGDLMHLWAIMLVRNDEPGVQDIVKLARGEWLYRILRFSVSVRNPPVNMRMSVHTHHALRGIRRGYLYPTDFMPEFIKGTFEWAYRAALTNYGYHVAVATLPGDRIYIELYNKQPFEGQLRILSYI